MEKKRLRLLKAGINLIREDMDRAKELALEKCNSISNIGIAVYSILLWTQNKSLVDWAKSHEDEMRNSFLKFSSSKAAFKLQQSIGSYFKQRVIYYWRAYTVLLKKLRPIIKRLRIRRAIKKWRENARLIIWEESILRKQEYKTMKSIIIHWKEVANRMRTLIEKYNKFTLRHSKAEKKKCLDIWRTSYIDHKRALIAIEFHKISLEKTVLLGLSHYLNNKQTKVSSYNTAISYNNHNILRRCMDNWKDYMKYKRSLLKSFELIRNKKCMSNVESMFNTWYTQYKEIKKAISHYKTKLKSKAYTSLNKWNEYKALKNQFIDNCETKREFSIILKAFKGFKVMVKRAQDLNLLERGCNRRSNEKILRRCLLVWGEYASKRIKKRNQRVIAETLIKNNLMFKAIGVLSAYAKIKKERNRKAFMISKNDCIFYLRSILNEWKYYVQRRKQMKEIFKIISIKQLINISIRALKTWIRRYEERVVRMNMFDIRLKTLVLKAWKDVIKKRKIFYYRLDSFLKRRAITLLKKAMVVLIGYKKRKTQLKLNKKMAVIYFFHRKLKQILHTLRYQTHLKRLYKEIRDKSNKSNKLRLLKQWKQIFIKAFKLKEFIVNRMQGGILEYFNIWSLSTIRIQSLKAVEQISNKRLKDEAFVRWKSII